jgi:DNA-directed RNA polymerase subunit P
MSEELGNTAGAEGQEVEEAEEGGLEERKIYMCLSCGRTFGKSELEILGRSTGTIRCPYCGYNIIVKVRVFKGSSITAV